MTTALTDLVHLTDDEIRLARMIGDLRLEHSRGMNAHRSTVRTEQDRQADEHLGCMGELALAKRLGIAWAPTLYTFRDEPNVGSFDVSTTRNPTHCLIVRDNDVPSRRMVLVTDQGGGLMWVRGWITAEEGRAVGQVRNPGGRRPSWFVNPANLHPLDEAIR